MNRLYGESVLSWAAPVLAEATEKFEYLQSLTHPIVAREILSLILGGIDLSSYSLDDPLPEDLPQTNASVSSFNATVSLARRENLTIRQLALRMAGARGKSVIKGTPESIADQMEAADAEVAKLIGFDGVQVSNHGGRQFEAAPASADVLPAIAAAVGTDMTILCDGGVRSGTDVARMLALGADATFAGRAFLYGVGAIGAPGAQYFTDLLAEELQAAMRQMGAVDFLSLRSFAKRHVDAVIF